LTEFLYKILNQKVPHLIGDSTNDLEVVKHIKESMCIVAQDFDAEMKAASE